MQEECIVCKAPLIYLEQDEWMECELCHKKELSRPDARTGIMFVMIVIRRDWTPFFPCV